jgi:hypothetical protein
MMAPSTRAEGPGRSPVAGSAQVASLEQLLTSFRASPGLEARFIERRVMALLAAPLTSEGTLYVAPPGLLARHVTRPSPSFQIIEPDRVRFGDASKIETIDLAQRPQIRGFVETFVALLAGDKAALERDYAVRFGPRPDGGWLLSLTPLRAPVNRVIASITLTGQGLLVSEMRIVEVEGDETVTTFTHVDSARRFTTEELDRHFLRRKP